MRASLALLAACLPSSLAWYGQNGNQTFSVSSTVVAPSTDGVPHPTGGPLPPNPVHPPGTGIQPPKPTSPPTGTSGSISPTTTPVPPVITKTVYGPGTATITQTFIGTTSITSTITRFLPCSTPVATMGSYTYYSTSLTTSLSLTTFTAETTSYVVICPTPTPWSGSGISGNHPDFSSPNFPSSPIVNPSACPPAVTITHTVYLPAPSPPAGHASGSGNGMASGNEKGSGQGSGSAPDSNNGSKKPQHPPVNPPGSYHPNPPAPYPSSNGTRPAHPTGSGNGPIASGVGKRPAPTGGFKLHY
ncbi:MAG: hypothetical protein Q9204_000611 [Flavoplaca sp. TL-2023a]